MERLVRLAVVLVFASGLFLASCLASASPVDRFYDSRPGARDSVLYYLPKPPQRFNPPQIYESWWNGVRSCLVRADEDLREVEFSDIEFWTFSEAWSLNRLMHRGHELAGLRVNDDILLKEELTENRGLVKHEMLHAIMADPRHDPFLFRQCDALP